MIETTQIATSGQRDMRSFKGARKTTGNKPPKGYLLQRSPVTVTSEEEQVDDEPVEQPVRRRNWAKRSRGALLPVVSRQSHTRSTTPFPVESSVVGMDTEDNELPATSVSEAESLDEKMPIAGALLEQFVHAIC